MATEKENVNKPAKTSEEVSKDFYKEPPVKTGGTATAKVDPPATKEAGSTESVKTDSENKPETGKPKEDAGKEKVKTAEDGKTTEEVVNTKPADDKTTETEKKPDEPVVPEKYELKIPDGSKLKATAVERIARTAREQGLTNDEAQQLLVQEHEAVTTYQTEQDQELAARKSGWKTDLESDPVLGGDNLKANSELVRRGLEANFSKETIAFIDTLELGNNKFLFKDLLKLGNKLKDDKIGILNGGQPPAGRKPVAQVFFGADAK